MVRVISVKEKTKEEKENRKCHGMCGHMCMPESTVHCREGETQVSLRR